MQKSYNHTQIQDKRDFHKVMSNTLKHNNAMVLYQRIFQEYEQNIYFNIGTFCQF